LAELISPGPFHDVSFVQVEDARTYGDIRVAFTTAFGSSNYGGWAYEPGYWLESGDIWLNPAYTDAWDRTKWVSFCVVFKYRTGRRGVRSETPRDITAFL